MYVLYGGFIFMVGGCLASFFYLLAGRLPRKERIGWSRSHCDTCHHVLSPLTLIPVLSFLCLGGKCRYCHTKFSPLYLFYEAVGGTLVIYLTWHYPDAYGNWFLYLLLFLIAVVDQQHFIIPDLFQIGLFLLILASHHSNGQLGNPAYLLGAFAMLLVSGISALLVRDGLGGGDIKLLGLFGWALGFHGATLVLFLASLMGLSSIFMRHHSNKEQLHAPIPFGPFLVLAFFFVREIA